MSNDENGKKKLINCFLLLHLKYENKSENDKTGHENERELTKYREFRKRNQFEWIYVEHGRYTKTQYGIPTHRTKWMTKHIHDQV
jgi:hypothetical protein